MGIILREIVKQVSHLEMELMAGEKGLDREVSWTHMVDSDTVSAFLQGQELVFTTGLGLNEDLSLLRLVKAVYRNGASGIVVNLGPYISQIDESVLDFADANDFPVFSVPWHIRMAEIMRIICFSITKEDKSRIKLNAALNNAVLCPGREELYVSSLMQKGYGPHSEYAAVVLRIAEKGKSIAEERMEWLGSRLVSHLRCNYRRILCCTQEKQLVLVFCDYESAEFADSARSIFTYICRQLSEQEEAVLCQGKQVPGIRRLYQSFEQAGSMADLLQVFDIPGEERSGRHKLLFYEQLGMYQLLLTLQDREAMQEYVAHTVQPLYEYDALNQGDLTKVLPCYLAHNCSVKETAKELIVHRNTVNYKIAKASDILHMDLTGFEARFRLQLGFMVYQLLHVRTVN